MPQSAQIILKKNYLDTPSEILVYHFTWGFGRIMPTTFMSLIFDCYYHTITDGKRRDNLKDVTFNEERVLEYEKELKGKDIWDAKLLRDCKNEWENNNGFMIIEMDERNNLSETKVKIGFVQGTEQKPFGAVKIVPFKKFYAPWKNEYGKAFETCFNSFCESYEIEQYV